jgi:hypothetical protein
MGRVSFRPGSNPNHQEALPRLNLNACIVATRKHVQNPKGQEEKSKPAADETPTDRSEIIEHA